MPRPGQAHVVITQESIGAVNSLVRENRRTTTQEIADSLSVSKGTADTLLHEHLLYSKVCAQWVPKHLTEDQKRLRMGVCFQHLLRYRTEGNNFLSWIVACDETWCHFFQWEVLHHPPYSPDLSPCNFHVFRPLKKALKGRPFTDNDEVRETIEEWFCTQPKTFFADGIHRLVGQWDTCFNQQGDYV